MSKEAAREGGRPESGDAAAPDLRTWLIALCLCLACLAAYFANGRLLPPAGDDIPNRLIPFSLFGWGTLTLDPFRHQLAADPAHFYLQERRGSMVSLYLVGAAAVALPVYLPCYLWLRARGHDSPAYLFEASKVAEKLAAATIAALCVGVLFVMLRRRVSTLTAVAIALAFGLGSGVWAIASQLLWQHGPGVLCLLLGMLVLTLSHRALASVAAGFFLGMAYAVRPQNALFLVAAATYLALRGEGSRERVRAVLGLALGSLLPVAATLAYNQYYYGTILGGYILVTPHLQPRLVLQGLAGLLLSPNRGLLVFSPAALLGLWGMAVAFRRWRSELLLASFCAAAALYALLHAATTTWAGGGSFGPRYLTETLPVLALAASLVVPALPAWGRAGALLLVAGSILVEIDGVVCYPSSNWNARMAAYPEANWDYRHPILYEDFATWLARRTHRSRPTPAPLPDSAFKVEWRQVRWRRMNWPSPRWASAGVLEDLHPGDRVLALVALRNASDCAWPDPAAVDPARSGAYAVRLAYRWHRASWSGPYQARSDLREPLAPGQAATVWIPVIAPAEPGDYQLQFDLVEEGVAWFAAKGAAPLVLAARVKTP